MVKRSSSKGPLARKIARAIEHGSASITSLQVIEYIRAFKLRYPDSDIELAQPMIMCADTATMLGSIMYSWWIRTYSRTTRSSSPTGGAHTRYGRTTGRSRGHWPSAVPTARAQKTCPFIAKGFFFFISFFRRKHLLPNVLALSRITRRVCGHVDPRLSALP